MPLSIYEKLGLGELRNTHITLQLVDSSSVQLKEVLEDMLVKVYNFNNPGRIHRETPILLGRPFLATSRSTIDLENNELIMKINGETEGILYDWCEKKMQVLRARKEEHSGVT
ncbi:Retrovirus-related Pol polyprotein from transposon opus [Gossypium australe]|uniref:Retrovirus-related Pol polyprotein from transposon opus n=1 Tax=Gossypium australe TaxID=47621 RepID=A0A5B6VBN6_9ROSI|nr:Retrovirus-related Pol polyprotein from transposon opus [Gossypium australe]